MVQLLISDLLLSQRTALWQKQAGASQALGETYHASGAELAGFQRDLGSLRRLAHSFCPAYHKVRPSYLVEEGRLEAPQGPAQQQHRVKELVLGSHPADLSNTGLDAMCPFVQFLWVEYLLCAWPWNVVVSRSRGPPDRGAGTSINQRLGRRGLLAPSGVGWEGPKGALLWFYSCCQ